MPVIINGTTGISGVDGSAGTPAFQGSDANTGIRFGTDIVSLVTGGSDRLYIDSSGRLGVGTTSPGNTLHVVGTARFINGSNPLIISTDGGDPFVYTESAAGLKFGANSAVRMAIDSSGRLGVGVSSPIAQTHIRLSSVTGYSSPSNDGLVIERGGGNDLGISIATENTRNGYLIFADGDSANPAWVGYDHSVNAMSFRVNASERARIDSSGRLLVGTSTGYNDARLQVVGNTGGDPGRIDIRRNADNPVANSEIGTIRFSDLNGASGQYATIQCFADAASTSSSDFPGRLVFNTTSDGSASPTERARLTSAGYFKASPDNSYNSSAGSYHEFNNNLSNNAAIISRVNNASYADHAYVIACYRSANNAYSFIRCDSGDGGTNPFNDTEFRLRGDGNGTCDGAWTGGGADYAEYFEWADSNPNEEDRRGISVVLDGDKIREAVAGDEPIGVISGNPSVVGDAAWNKWSGKYLRDDFGTYIQEDYEVINDDGETVIQQRRKLNPAYDPTQEYIPREDRPEWDCVGLMGKLRICKGQVTGSRWIKMRDISATVEEWLVR